MIATGGLLRMNRRTDSIRSKNRAENKRKRKAMKRRKKNDIVVVKGKLSLCSPAGLVAAVGVVVLMVGIAMAVLGYWPINNYDINNDNHRGLSKPQFPNGQAGGEVRYYKSPERAPERPGNNTFQQRALVAERSSDNGSRSEPPSSSGFLQDFLDNYLHSDNLKVFGPLVMGIGIFLFICANAVLHENRDKKTKIINLRDIYSTVIDLHSVRTKDYSPINGLVNYSQTSRGLEAAPGRGSWPSTALGAQGEPDESLRRLSLACRPRSWSREVQTFTDTVYSIYRDHAPRSTEDTPRPKEWETTSIVASSVNAFTLPVIKLNNCEVEEAERTEEAGGLTEEEEGELEDAGEAIGGDDGTRTQAGNIGNGRALTDTKETAGSVVDSPRGSQDVAEPQQQQGLQGAPPQWAKLQLLPPCPVARVTGSRLSLNSLSDQPGSARRCSLSVSVCRQGDRARRFSCPRLDRSNSKGYIKLTDLGGESFEAPDTDVSSLATGQEVATTTAATAPAGDEAPVTPSTSAET